MFSKADSLACDLPLSWTRSTSHSVQKEAVAFKTSRMHWISLAHIPENKDFNDILAQLHAGYPQGLLLRGCSAAIAHELAKVGFEIIPIGQEAVIDLKKPVFKNRNLRQSARSGNRHNTIRRVELNQQNRKKLNRLKKESRHGGKPQLKNLFIDTFSPHTQCFVAENDMGWNAAITFSHVNRYKAQAELLLRKSCAAGGTMEALIEQALKYTREKGYHFFSLGEVPFEIKHSRNQPLKSRIACKIGKAAHFAYNSATLYKFKDKFSPNWQPLYLCGYPNISIRTLAEMAIRTNYFKLVIFQLFFGRKN